MLLADDEQMVLDDVGRRLRSAGYSVSLARNSFEAFLELAQRGAARLLIADQKMPGPAGIFLIEKCAMMYPDMPIILYSGNVDGALAIRAGRYEIVRKGQDAPHVIIDAVRRLAGPP